MWCWWRRNTGAVAHSIQTWNTVYEWDRFSFFFFFGNKLLWQLEQKLWTASLSSLCRLHPLPSTLWSAWIWTAGVSTSQSLSHTLAISLHLLTVMTNWGPSTHEVALWFRNLHWTVKGFRHVAQEKTWFSACVWFSPVLFGGIVLHLTVSELNSLALSGTDATTSWFFFSACFGCVRPFSFSLSLLFSLSLCFFDFFLDLLLQGAGLLSRGPGRAVCPGDDVPALRAGRAAELDTSEGGWLSLSEAAVSWGSQSLPLWLESLLTSDSASKWRGISSIGRCWMLDVMAASDAETAAPACAPAASPLPQEEPSLPFTGADGALLARCDILGFLLTSGSIKSTAGRFWKTNHCFCFFSVATNGRKCSMCAEKRIWRWR